MKLNQHSKQGEQLQKNGEEIIKIARKYGIFELDLLKAIDEVNALPKVELGHPQQEAQSITVKPDTASVSANRASAGNRSNQKLTEVSSELDPQQQESRLALGTIMRAVPCGETIWLDDLENMESVQSLLSTERQRAFDAGYAKGSLDEKRMRLYGKDKDAYPENFLGIKEVKKTERQRVLDEVRELVEGFRGLEDTTGRVSLDDLLQAIEKLREEHAK